MCDESEVHVPNSIVSDALEPRLEHRWKKVRLHMKTHTNAHTEVG